MDIGRRFGRVDCPRVVYFGHERAHARARIRASLPLVRDDSDHLLAGGGAGPRSHRAGRQPRSVARTGGQPAFGSADGLPQYRAAALPGYTASGAAIMADGPSPPGTLVCAVDAVDRHRAPAGRILLVAGREPASVALCHVFLRHGPADRLGIPVSLRICVRVRADRLPGAGVTLADPRAVDGAGRLACAPGGHDAAGRVCDGHARLGAARAAHGPGGGLRATG